MLDFTKLVMVGGHSRNIGKTSVVAGIIKGIPELNWTAVKITQTGHNVCADDGENCECEVPVHEFLLTEETENSSRADTTRFLAAGAKRSLWLRTRQEELVFALPKLKEELEKSDFIIIESNSLRRFWTPKLYLQVLDPTIEDFKNSAKQFFDLADAYVIVEQLSEIEGKEKNVFVEKNSFANTQKQMLKENFRVTSREKFINSTVVNFVRKKLCG